MSKSSRTKYLLIVFLVLLISGLSLLPKIVAEGRSHVETASIARQANEEWQSGHTAGATTKFVTAVGMTLEGGIRSILAQPFVEKSGELNKQVKLQEALDYCIKAVRILGKYDDEGSMSYYCSTIEVQLLYPELMPPRLATPITPVQP